MAGVDITQLKAQIVARGFKWEANALPPNQPPHGLGWNPTPAPVITAAIARARVLAAARMPSPVRTLGGPAGGPAESPAYPATFDWRDRSVIGPVTDQRYCGSCVSFATTGLVGAMAAIEHGGGVHLSEADQHFCSAHGANCFGWNNGDALNEIKGRGVAADADFPYMTAFDNPPVGDPNDHGNHPPLWAAHCHAVADRNGKAWRITDVTAWTGNDRKSYIANVGPLVCGFEVFEDFDNYHGGVYRHVMGASRGGHAVLVIGYSDTEQCWICRNSWGTGFGDPGRTDGTGGGFFKIGYGECSIDGEAFHGAHGVISPVAQAIVEQHNLFRSADGHIHALWFNFAAGWHHEDRTLLKPGTPTAVGDPFGYAFIDGSTGL
jgi:hypothetical protein